MFFLRSTGTRRTNIIVGRSSKIFLKFSCIYSIYILVCIKITRAGIIFSTRIWQWASSKILFKFPSIGSILVSITVEISFTFTGISKSVTLRWITIFLISGAESIIPTSIVAYTRISFLCLWPFYTSTWIWSIWMICTIVNLIINAILIQICCLGDFF